MHGCRTVGSVKIKTKLWGRGCNRGRRFLKTFYQSWHGSQVKIFKANRWGAVLCWLFVVCWGEWKELNRTIRFPQQKLSLWNYLRLRGDISLVFSQFERRPHEFLLGKLRHSLLRKINLSDPLLCIIRFFINTPHRILVRNNVWRKLIIIQSLSADEDVFFRVCIYRIVYYRISTHVDEGILVSHLLLFRGNFLRCLNL